MIASPPEIMKELWVLRTHAELLVESIDRAMKAIASGDNLIGDAAAPVRDNRVAYPAPSKQGEGM
jgi:hypothetical protein